MFDNIQKMKQMYELQKSVKAEHVEIEKQGVRIIMNGAFEMEELHLNPELDVTMQEKAIKECYQEALKKMQMIVAQKFQGFMK